jgi:hypothetical protein
METYVVHIHRRPHADATADTLAGVVERTDAPVARPFACLAELLALLGIAARRDAIAVARDRRPSPRSKE